MTRPDLRQQPGGSKVVDPFDHRPRPRARHPELERALADAEAAGDTALVDRILAELARLNQPRKDDSK